MKQADINKADEELISNLVDALMSESDLAVVQAPPGSGKTHTLIEVVAKLVGKQFAVALAAQTNSQADDIARRFKSSHPKIQVIRLGSSKSYPPKDFPSTIQWETYAPGLPRTPGVYISTSSKWSTLKDPQPFDLLAVDEAWQMSWANLMKCASLSKKFFLIGDPGQIPPVFTIDVKRWATSPRGPHLSAPDVVMADSELKSRAFLGNLNACRRLPNESVSFIRHFYSFDFTAFATPGERKITYQGNSELLELLQTGQPLVYTVPTPEQGALVEVDNRISKAIKAIVSEMIGASTKIVIKGGEPAKKLGPHDIGVTASHRSMNGDILKELGAEFEGIRVDTPERWQGLERPIMIAVHPLSNVTDPSEFDLETGRLCVMASRHQVGLILVTRDHVGRTLRDYIPSATQAPGLSDSVGRGHFAHRTFWQALDEAGRIKQLS